MTKALCSGCSDVQTLYNELNQPENLQSICLPVKVLLLNKHHSEKEDKVNEFVKKVSAVRNSGGGKVLIHLLGKRAHDRYLGNLDQFTDDPLTELIEDGTVCAENFFRSFLCDQKDFSEHTEFVVLDVRSSSSISTTNFNTRVCSDQSVRRPTRFNILSLLRSSAKKTQKRKTEARQDNTRADTKRIKLEDLHESRSVQLKTFAEDKITGILTNPFELAKYIWVNLRLREYVTSMSMLDNGGSYYLGIKEKEIKLGEGENKYNSKTANILGVQLNDRTKACLKDKLFEQCNTDISVFLDNGEGRVISSPERNILDIKWHADNPGAAVCEVIVKPVKGVVFFDCGPKSYHFVENEIVELDTDTWFQKIQESISLDGSGLWGSNCRFRIRAKVSKDMAKVRVMPTSYCFPVTLMEIENSMHDITEHVLGVRGKESSMYPPQLSSLLLKECKSVMKNIKNFTCNENGLVYLSRCMAVALNIKECRSHIPEKLVCDIFIAGEMNPPMFITITESKSEPTSKAIRIYNAKVKKGIVRYLRMFTDESISVVHGCMTKDEASNMEVFEERLNNFREEESISAIPDSLKMNPIKCSAVCDAFFHSAASTRVVFPDTKTLGLLTKKQFEIVSETLNDRDNVLVQSGASSGASILLMDLADRLEVAGRTLLVCKKSSDAEIARKIYSDSGSNLKILNFEEFQEDRKGLNCSDFKFILIESNTVQEYGFPESGVRIWNSAPEILRASDISL